MFIEVGAFIQVDDEDGGMVEVDVLCMGSAAKQYLGKEQNGCQGGSAGGKTEAGQSVHNEDFLVMKIRNNRQ